MLTYSAQYKYLMEVIFFKILFQKLSNAEDKLIYVFNFRIRALVFSVFV